MLDIEHLHEKIKLACTSRSNTSISGLGEALGIPPASTRQAKSWKVKDTVRKIQEAFALLGTIAEYLETSTERLLFSSHVHDKLNQLLKTDDDREIAEEMELLRRILALPEDDRELIKRVISKIILKNC